MSIPSESDIVIEGMHAMSYITIHHGGMVSPRVYDSMVTPPPADTHDRQAASNFFSFKTNATTPMVPSPTLHDDSKRHENTIPIGPLLDVHTGKYPQLAPVKNDLYPQSGTRIPIVPFNVLQLSYPFPTQQQQQYSYFNSMPDCCCEVARKWKEKHTIGCVPHAKDRPVAVEQKKKFKKKRKQK